MNNKCLKHIASAMATCLSMGIVANMTCLSASAYLTITPTKYVGYVNYNYTSSSPSLYYLNYVRAAESYDSRYITYNGVVAGPWALSSPSATVVMDGSSVWETVTPYATFYKNTSSTDFTNIYRMKFTYDNPVLGVINVLQEPIVILAKVNGSQLSPSEFDDSFICGLVAVGDVDGNGVLAENDRIKLYNYLYNSLLLTDNQKIAADVDLDGDIDSTDLSILESVLNGNGNFW